ncbi:hypothetical protein GR7B_00132 [Vibrio phage vB_VcorM_GR7B]|nr:hypothetical protein GR7B_00132 [Vibrio phage vB_VcorM_GR7B]
MLEKHNKSLDFVLSALVKVSDGNLEGALANLVSASKTSDFNEAIKAMDARQQELFDKDNSDDDTTDDGMEAPDYKSKKEL